MRLVHVSVFCFTIGRLWWPRFQIDTRSHSLRRANQRKDMLRKFITALVNESYTTKTGSRCQLIPASSPKGRAGFGMRGWTCCHCGAVHDRDVNAARNILALGHERFAGGIPFKSCSVLVGGGVNPLGPLHPALMRTTGTPPEAMRRLLPGPPLAAFCHPKRRGVVR